MWGNLAFTGTLLLATFWHIDEFNWSQFTPPTAHIWVILYIFEPVVDDLPYSTRRVLRAQAPVSGGPILLLVQAIPRPRDRAAAHARPAPGDQPGVRGAPRWAWELNPFDARIVAAWFLGWSVWCGTMAFARDWDEIRTAARLFIVNGVALLATMVVFRDGLTGVTSGSYIWGISILTVAMAAFHVLQERRRPT